MIEATYDDFDSTFYDPIDFRPHRDLTERVSIELEVRANRYDWAEEIRMAEEPRSRAERAERAYQQFAAPKQKSACRCPETFACPLHNWQHKDFGNPSVVLAPEQPDHAGAVRILVEIVKAIARAKAYESAIETLVKIIHVVQRGWAMDDTSKRFGMLELD